MLDCAGTFYFDKWLSWLGLQRQKILEGLGFRVNTSAKHFSPHKSEHGWLVAVGSTSVQSTAWNSCGG